MVMTPPWSSPDPAVTPPPVKAKKTAAKKAVPRKTATAPAPPKKAAAKKATTKSAKKPTSPTSVQETAPTPPAPKQPEQPSPRSSTARPRRELGPVEAAVLKELQDANVAHSALAASALAMARNVDEAETAAGASAAARELRLVLPLARTTVNPLSPPAEPERADDDGTVVGPTRLDALRKRAAKRASS